MGSHRMSLAVVSLLFLFTVASFSTSVSAQPYAVGFTTATASSTTNSVALNNQNIPSVFNFYFWTEAQATTNTMAVALTQNAVVGSNYLKNGVGGTNDVIIGYNSVTNPSLGQFQSNTVGLPVNSIMAGLAANLIYINKQSGVPYAANGVGTSGSLSYTVSTSNSFVVLLFATAGNIMTSFGTSLTNNYIAANQVGTIGSAQVSIMTVNSVIGGTYSATESTARSVSYAMAAYVFPQYPLTLGFTPGSQLGTITTNGLPYWGTSNIIPAIGSSTFSVTPPANYVFTSWAFTSNSAGNYIIGSSTASSTNLDVMGQVTVNALTTSLNVNCTSAGGTLFSLLPLSGQIYANNDLSKSEYWYIETNGLAATSTNILLNQQIATYNTIATNVALDTFLPTSSNVALTYVNNPRVTVQCVSSGGTTYTGASPISVSGSVISISSSPSFVSVSANTFNGNLVANNAMVTTVNAVTLMGNFLGSNAFITTVTANFTGNNAVLANIYGNLLGYNSISANAISANVFHAVTASANLLANNAFAVTFNGNFMGNNAFVVTMNGNVLGNNAFLSSSVNTVSFSGNIAISVANVLTYSVANILSIPQATGSLSGYLASGDWTIFNNKQASGTYLTAVSGGTGAYSYCSGTTCTVTNLGVTSYNGNNGVVSDAVNSIVAGTGMSVSSSGGAWTINSLNISLSKLGASSPLALSAAYALTCPTCYTGTPPTYSAGTGLQLAGTTFSLLPLSGTLPIRITGTNTVGLAYSGNMFINLASQLDIMNLSIIPQVNSIAAGSGISSSCVAGICTITNTAPSPASPTATRTPTVSR